MSFNQFSATYQRDVISHACSNILKNKVMDSAQTKLGMGNQRERTCYFDRELDDFEGQNEKTDTSAIVPASDIISVVRGQNMR